MNGAKGFSNELVLELTFVRNSFECVEGEGVQIDMKQCGYSISSRLATIPSRLS